jgi:hypothetical protein
MDVPDIVASAPTSDELYIGDTRHLPAGDIASAHGYVRDYVTRLCREGKVRGRRLGRFWYVDTESFTAFVHRNENSTAPESALPMV